MPNPWGPFDSRKGSPACPSPPRPIAPTSKSSNGWSISSLCPIRGSARRCGTRSTNCCCSVCWRCWPGAESWVEVAAFGRKKREFLRRIEPFAKGTPSFDQLGDLCRVLGAEAFQQCFIDLVASLTELGPDLIAIDGKTLGRSYQEGGAKAPIHMISAWAGRQRLVLGQCKVAAKSNEITAIPELLDLLTLSGGLARIGSI
jgi:hypothetical protein